MSKFDPEKIKKLQKVDKAFKSIYLFPKNKKRREPIVNAPVNRILIIASMMIGDTIMLIPALRVLKKKFPDARISLLCEPVVQIILADQRLADDFYIIKTPWLHKNDGKKQLYQIWQSIREANTTKYDIAIDFRGDWRNIFLMNFIKARRKISFNYSGGEYMLTDIVPSPDKSVKHYIDEWLYLLEYLGCKAAPEDKYPILNLTKDSEKILQAFIAENNLQSKFIIGIHPGASVAARKWDEKKYADLIINIAKTQPESVFVLFEGPGERNTVEQIKAYLNKMSINPLVVNVNLKKYIILMRVCDLIICNDSGAGHIAGALNKPSVILFGKADPETVKPYNKNQVRLISHLSDESLSHGKMDNKDYLDTITVTEVYNEVTDLTAELQKSKGI